MGMSRRWECGGVLLSRRVGGVVVGVEVERVGTLLAPGGHLDPG